MASLPPLEVNGHTNGSFKANDGPASTPPASPPAPASFSLRRNIRKLPPISAFLCVALGGALGALLRYGFTEACASYQLASTTSLADDGITTIITLHKPFPAATFISNMLGCFTIGILSILLPATITNAHTLLLTRSLFITGFLGALTTMSSFVLDTALLFQHQHSKHSGDENVVVAQEGEGREWVGVVYWLVTNVGGVALVGVGRMIGRWIERRYVRRVERDKGAGSAGDG